MPYSYEAVPEHERQRWIADNKQHMQDLNEGNQSLPLIQNHLFRTEMLVDRQAEEIKRLKAWLEWLAKDAAIGPVNKDVESALAGCKPPKFFIINNLTSYEHIRDDPTCPSTQ